MENLQLPQDLQENGKPVIVLDLDDTIISSSLIKMKPSSFAVKVGNRRYAYINTRPGFLEFIKEIKNKFEVFFFTASTKAYGNQIIDIISPDTPSSHRLFRNSCENISGYLVKDLRKINRPLNKIILIDDLQGSALLQPENLVHITSWYDDENDTVLLNQLLPILQRIEKSNNLSTTFKKIISQETGHYNDLSSF